MTQKIAVYLRQSKDQSGKELAVDRQREACLKLCADEGWSDTVEYCDNNISASSRSVVRPKYRQMLKDVEAGLISGIVVWDLDRLYRQPRELEDLIDLANDRNLRLATATGDCDLGSDNGRLYARMKGVVAKAEGERKSARWKLSNMQGAEAGKWVVGYRPFGYTRTGKQHKTEGAAVRKAYRDVLNGTQSLRAVAKSWNEQGFTTPDRLDKDGKLKKKGVPWGNRQVRKLLLNKRYAGRRVLTTTERDDDGKRVEVTYDFKGQWKPLVDKKTFDGVTAKLKDPSRVICTTFETRWPGVGGVYRCGRDGCGAPLKTHYDSRGTRLYACKAQSHLTRRGDSLDDYVAVAVLERLADAGLKLIEPEKVDVVALNAERDAYVARRDELSRLLSDGLLSAAAVRRDATKLTAKIADVDRKLADAAIASPTAALLAGSGDLRTRWDKLPPSLQGQIIDEVAVVTVLPCPRGLRGFDPDYIDLRFRRDV